MAKLNVDVKPRGTASACVSAPFDEGKEALAKEGYRIISLSENVRLRMQEGVNADISQDGNWIKEGAVYVPQKGVFLTKNSPIIANAKESTACHRSGKEFYLTDEQVEQSLIDSVKLTAGAIPINKFGKSEITAYAFGENAEKYGQFLKEAGINEMPVWLAEVSDKAFARQMWLCGLADGAGSLLCGHSRNLDASYWVRGVSECAEGTAKNLEVYNPSQIEKALEYMGLSGISKGLIEKLRN